MLPGQPNKYRRIRCSIKIHFFIYKKNNYKYKTEAYLHNHYLVLSPARMLGIDVDALHQKVQEMVNLLGSDPAEQLCEVEAHKLFTEGSLLDHGVPLFCQS